MRWDDTQADETILAGLAGRKESSIMTTALDRLSADVRRLRELVA
jgi:hypothetical protein